MVSSCFCAGLGAMPQPGWSVTEVADHLAPGALSPSTRGLAGPPRAVIQDNQVGSGARSGFCLQVPVIVRWGMGEESPAGPGRLEWEGPWRRRHQQAVGACSVVQASSKPRVGAAGEQGGVSGVWNRACPEALPPRPCPVHCLLGRLRGAAGKQGRSGGRPLAVPSSRTCTHMPDAS